MTRINAGIDPRKLKRAHLIAEIREITMVPASLRRSLKTRRAHVIKQEIPKQFSLNKGHVKFFYNKLAFLQKRFMSLADEMERRGYRPDRGRIRYFDGFDSCWYNDWNATEADNDVVFERINMRIAQKPHLYQDVLN
jgi:deoxyribonuclease (pyrimidine dimer)